MINKFDFLNDCKIMSFDANSSTDYKLESLNNIDEVYSKVIDILYRSANSDEVIIALRGDTKNSYFKNNQLNKFFIVGEKGKWFRRNKAAEIYSKNFNDKEELVKDIKSHIDEINAYIKSRDELKGELKYPSEEISIENLRMKKMIFMSILHNMGGRVWNNKNNSPFISLTFGEDMYEIASKYGEVKDDKIAFIFVYSIPKGSKYYRETQLINEMLLSIDGKWFDNRDNEIIAVDGVFPHYLIGILTIENEIKKEFILNPWLYKQIMNGDDYNPIIGIDVDQSGFEQNLKDLGYRRHYVEQDGYRTHYDNKSNRIGESTEIV